jgi:hypothetical protein
MPPPPQKPTWRNWLLGVFLWAAAYLLCSLLFRRAPWHHSVAAAFESGLFGVSLFSLLQWRRWRKYQQIPTN